MAAAQALQREERGEVVQLVGVAHDAGAQAGVRAWLRERRAQVRLHVLERTGLRAADGELAGRRFVAVGPEVGVGARPALGLGLPVLPRDEHRRAPQIIGGVVGAEIAAVPEDRAVLHETILEEELLALEDVLPRVQQAPIGEDHALRDRGMVGVGLVGEHAQDREAGQEDDDRGLEPAARDEHCSPLRHG